MNSVFLPSSLFPLPSPLRRSVPSLSLQPRYNFLHHRSATAHLSSISFPSSLFSLHFLHNSQSSIRATTPSNEEAISVINFEDFVDKDWSFLESSDTNSDEELSTKIDRIISEGKIGEDSKILVSIGSEIFVDRIVDSVPCQLLLVVHDSLLVLACIKEKYDNVKCWQGELIYVPEKWTPFDVVFLYFLPALPFQLDQIFEALVKRISPGARVVISHPQGRQVLEQQRQRYPEMVISDLPDETTLKNVAADHSFEMGEFVDEPGFYLAVLKFRDT